MHSEAGIRPLTLATSFVKTCGRSRLPQRLQTESSSLKIQKLANSSTFYSLSHRVYRRIGPATSSSLRLTSRRPVSFDFHSYRAPIERRKYAHAANALARPIKKLSSTQPSNPSSPETPPSQDTQSSRSITSSEETRLLLSQLKNVQAINGGDDPHQQFQLGDESEDERLLRQQIKAKMTDPAKIIDGTAIAK